MITFKLEHVIEGVISDYPPDQRRVLRKLSGVKLSAAEAATAWQRVLEHKWYLSESLERDVGLRVAAVDYFENVQPPREARAGGGGLPPRLPFMRPLFAR